MVKVDKTKEFAKDFVEFLVEKVLKGMVIVVLWTSDGSIDIG